MSELEKAAGMDFAERAEQLSREAEELRPDEKAVPKKVQADTDELDEAVASSVKKLRRFASR